MLICEINWNLMLMKDKEVQVWKLLKIVVINFNHLIFLKQNSCSICVNTSLSFVYQNVF